MSMVIMAFSVILAILSLCILTQNKNLENLNKIILTNIDNLKNYQTKLPESPQLPEDLAVINAKVSNETEELQYPSTYYIGTL